MIPFTASPGLAWVAPGPSHEEVREETRGVRRKTASPRERREGDSTWGTSLSSLRCHLFKNLNKLFWQLLIYNRQNILKQGGQPLTPPQPRWGGKGPRWATRLTYVPWGHLPLIQGQNTYIHFFLLQNLGKVQPLSQESHQLPQPSSSPHPPVPASEPPEEHIGVDPAPQPQDAWPSASPGAARHLTGYPTRRAPDARGSGQGTATRFQPPPHCGKAGRTRLLPAAQGSSPRSQSPSAAGGLQAGGRGGRGGGGTGWGAAGGGAGARGRQRRGSIFTGRPARSIWPPARLSFCSLQCQIPTDPPSPGVSRVPVMVFPPGPQGPAPRSPLSGGHTPAAAARCYPEAVLAGSRTQAQD